MTIENWLIVSNRLPLVSQDGRLRRGSGGLITAITGIKTDATLTWIGAVPGVENKAEFCDALGTLDDPISYAPLFLEQGEYDAYYNGFCNDALWPLLHYETSNVKYNLDAWSAYISVNRKFAEKIAEISPENAVVWIHDFHLFLVPSSLKKLRPDLKVGFFLHVPFPSSEVFRQLPNASELLNELIGADLIGFHDYSYLRHFASSVTELLGYESGLLMIDADHHISKLGVYPASIDTAGFVERAESMQTSETLTKWKGNLRDNVQIILGVDRLDYSKGLDLKLSAFREMLVRNPSLVGKVQLIQLAIPSRTEVPEYIALKENVERLVGEINGEFGRTDFVPIKYIFKSVSAVELSALYRLADVLLVTSKRDGMNLVALEYVVSQSDENPGSLVLSKFAGASSTMFNSISINPWDIKDTSEKIYKALMAPKEKRVEKNLQMKKYLKNYTATTWARAFMKDLHAYNFTASKTEEILAQGEELPEILAKKIEDASEVVLFSDYDGTLTPIVNSPDDAMLSPEVRDLIKRLHEKLSAIYVVSGRDKEFLLSQFDGMSVSLSAEHGFHFYNAESKSWKTLGKPGRPLWYESAVEVMQHYADRVPESFVEKKKQGIAWHYRNSPSKFGYYQAQKLKVELEALLSDFPITVLAGKKVIEIKDVFANKGHFAAWAISQRKWDNPLYIAVGDDVTDEDLFKALRPMNSITVKVGKEESEASFRVSSQKKVKIFLEELLRH